MRDINRTEKAVNVANRKHWPSAESPAMNRIVSALEKHGPMSYQAIAEHAFVSYATVVKSNYMGILVNAGRVHISGWDQHRTGGLSRPIFSAGPGEAVPRPPPIDTRILAREQRVRSGISSALKAARRLRRPRDPALAALLGLGRNA